MRACVRACACVRVRACVRVCVCVLVCVRACVRVMYESRGRESGGRKGEIYGGRRVKTWTLTMHRPPKFTVSMHKTRGQRRASLRAAARASRKMKIGLRDSARGDRLSPVAPGAALH